MAGAAFHEGRLTSQDGLSLYFRDYGDRRSDRTPILCLPGLTRNSRDFHELAERLGGTGRRVVCPDLRGRGRSAYDPNWRNYDPPVYLNDIRHLLAALGLHRVIVIGTSLGGILAMAMGAGLPGVLAGVVLNDVGPEVGGPGLLKIAEYLRRDWVAPDWETAIAHMRIVFARTTIDADSPDWRRLAEGTYRRDADGMLRFDFDRDLVRPLLADPGQRHDLWPLFRSLRAVPLLTVRGGTSEVLDADLLERMIADRPDMRRVTVPGCGHVPLLNEPMVEEALDAFVAAL